METEPTAPDEPTARDAEAVEDVVREVRAPSTEALNRLEADLADLEAELAMLEANDGADI